MFWLARKPFKSDSNDYKINNQWFGVTCIILHNLQNTDLQTSLEKSILSNFQIGACWNQHSKPRKVIYIITSLIISDLGWLILFCVIYRTQICRSCLQRQLLATISLIINKKKKEIKNKTWLKTFLQAFTMNFSWISLYCIIYRTSIDHAQIN